jgi:hypothetical protein
MLTRSFADTGFALKTAVIVLVAHAIAYFSHEFSHSFAAWWLGYMSNPLALDYGTPTPANIIMLFGVSDNVQYDPIVESGHGFAAASIALAGPFIGNGLLYVCLCVAMKRLRQQNSLALPLGFWTLTMCAGNIWSYVPIRAITTHADIAIAAAGLHLSVLALFPFLFVPSLVLTAHFFGKVCTQCIPAMAPDGDARRVLIVTMTTVWFFFLYGGVGLFANYGAVSQVFSLISALLLLPVSTVWLWRQCSVRLR